jgi:hypothetical protein
VPVEKKVQASTAAAVVSGMAVWLLGRYVFRGAVPDVFVSWVYMVIPGAMAFAAGYFAKHTPRPGLDPPAAVPAPVITYGSRTTASATPPLPAPGPPPQEPGVPGT